MPYVQNTFMVWGIVAFNSGIPTAIHGTGNFSITRGGSGLFNVLFDESVKFSSVPTVVVTQIYNGGGEDDIDPTNDYDGGNPLDNAVVIAVDQTQFRLITGNSHGGKTDRMFSFIAVGPGSMTVNDQSKQVIYGNLGYDGDKLKGISTGGDVDLYQWGGEWIPTSQVGQPGVPKPEGGTYGVKLDWKVDNLALVLQQIWAGKQNSSDISDFEFEGGDTRDNAVADSVSISGDTNYFSAGDSSGDRQARMVGFIAVGG